MSCDPLVPDNPHPYPRRGPVRCSVRGPSHAGSCPCATAPTSALIRARCPRPDRGACTAGPGGAVVLSVDPGGCCAVLRGTDTADACADPCAEHYADPCAETAGRWAA